MKTLRERMEDYLIESGVKRKFVANKIGISPSHFTNWLHGTVKASDEVESRIRKYLEERE